MKKYFFVMPLLLWFVTMDAQEVSSRKVKIIKKCIDTILRENKLKIDSFNTLFLLDLNSDKVSFYNSPLGDYKVQYQYEDSVALKEFSQNFAEQTRDSILFVLSKKNLKKSFTKLL